MLYKSNSCSPEQVTESVMLLVEETHTPDKLRQQEAVMASRLHFLITNCPGPFRLVSGWVYMLEKHGNRFEIELTLKPVEAGIDLLGHDRKFKIPFEVVLMGATTKYGHGVEEPRNVRMLGRFLMPRGLDRDWEHLSDHALSKIAQELNEWQWEVVFNPGHQGNDSVGFVAKLDSPLPKDWTM